MLKAALILEQPHEQGLVHDNDPGTVIARNVQAPLVLTERWANPISGLLNPRPQRHALLVLDFDDDWQVVANEVTHALRTGTEVAAALEP